MDVGICTLADQNFHVCAQSSIPGIIMCLYHVWIYVLYTFNVPA